jgi:DnaK suppressor protein
MTNTELMNLKAALEAERLELAAQFSGRIRELTFEDRQPDPIDSLQGMSDRSEIAGMLSRFSSTLADVERCLCAIDENCYGNCIRCHRPIAVKRLQSIPWAAYCVRCQEQFEAEGEEGSTPDFDECMAHSLQPGRSS